MTDSTVPVRIRSLITVESGLNDGIATPIVLLAIAGATAAEHHGPGVAAALADLAVGALSGAATGCAGGWLLRHARHRGWTAEEFTGIAVLALALVAYALALAPDGNGFVAAFCGGMLTVVRMVPVALATWGAGMNRATILFVGWFGPRGLASLVFALLALEELGPAAITLTEPPTEP